MLETQLTEAPDLHAHGASHRVLMSRTVFGDILQFVDFIAITAISVIVALIYHDRVLEIGFDIQSYAAAGIVGSTAMTAILRRDGYYEFDRLASASRSMRGVIGRWLLVILGLLAFGFALKVSESFSRFWLFLWSGSTAVFLITTRIVTASIVRRAASEGGVFARRVAVIGAADIAAKFGRLAENTDRAVSVVGVYDVDLRNATTTRDFDLTGDLELLARAARNGEIDDIVIAAPAATSEEMTALVGRLSILPVSIAICANAQWLDHTGGEIVRIGAAPLLNLYRRPLEGWGGLVKILEDRLLGTLAFLAALPVLMLVSIAIKLQGKGPIFFKQKRHGFNNEVFTIYKFRTMTVAEDGDSVAQAQRNDSRVTPLGRFLRRYSLDELPQLINVMLGDMSLVGPRPHALAHNHAYAKTVENYSGRHKMKPGITGWAQVNGFRGETSENELMADRVRFDLDYVDNWSLWFDLKILVLTVDAVLFPKNAY